MTTPTEQTVLAFGELREALGEGAKSAARLAALLDGCHSPGTWRKADREQAIDAARKLHALLIKAERILLTGKPVDTPGNRVDTGEQPG